MKLVPDGSRMEEIKIYFPKIMIFESLPQKLIKNENEKKKKLDQSIIAK